MFRTRRRATTSFVVDHGAIRASQQGLQQTTTLRRSHQGCIRSMAVSVRFFLASPVFLWLLLRLEPSDGLLSMPSSHDSKLRRSQRLLWRSSSLGDESRHGHFATTGSDGLEKSNSDDPRQFTIGLLADIQYAPIPDGFSYSGIPRYYRHALETARSAAAHFQQEKVDLVLNLG